MQADWNVRLRGALYVALLLIVAVTIPAVAYLFRWVAVMEQPICTVASSTVFTCGLGVLSLLFCALFFAVTDADVDRPQGSWRTGAPRSHACGKRTMATTGRCSANRAVSAADLQRYTDTLLFDHYRRTLTFDFGNSDADDLAIARRLKEGMGPSPV